MKHIAVLGSTGSIGVQTLNVVRRHSDKLKIVALTANENVELLSRQICEFQPELAGICNESKYDELKTLSGKVKTELAAGDDVTVRAAGLPSADTVVAAVMGAAGVRGVYEAILCGKRVALANKESMVAAGRFLIAEAERCGAEIVPVDSEHSAIFQVLRGENHDSIERIVLTASGGPFRDAKSADELRDVTVEAALSHPTWRMSPKISVDSATMANKGLELIEARWLFDCTKLDYIIHRESIVHSYVVFRDGSVKAQLGVPSMEHPISYALFFPERAPKHADYAPPHFGSLNFQAPNETLFPFPRLAKKAIELDGSAPAVLNAANEAAVRLFLEGHIGFTDITRIVEHTLYNEQIRNYSGIDDIMDIHDNIYQKTYIDNK